MTQLSRRTLLASAVRGAAGLALGTVGLRSLAAHAQDADSIDLGGGARVLKSAALNVLAVSTGDGLALVDGGAAGQSSGLLQRVSALGKVHTLFNTHWHPEQTGSNESLGKAGASIVAHENTRQWLTED